MTIIGIAGFKGSGKSTAAQYLKEQHAHVQVLTLGFADPIKRALRHMFQDIITDQQLYGESANRETPVGEFENIRGEPLTARYLLQTMGTDWGRNMVDPDLWVKLTVDKARRFLRQNGGLVVIPDVRFVNEVQAIHNAGGVVWFIDRPCAAPLGEVEHASEAELQTNAFRDKMDHVVANYTDVEAFDLNLSYALKQLPVQLNARR